MARRMAYYRGPAAFCRGVSLVVRDSDWYGFSRATSISATRFSGDHFDPRFDVPLTDSYTVLCYIHAVMYV